MAGRDWNNLGQDLNRIIEDAIHMGDFGRLNENIRGAFGRAFPGMGQGYFGGDEEWDFNLSGGKKQRDYSNSTKTCGRADSYAGKNSDEMFCKNENFKTGKKSPYFAGKARRCGSGAGFIAGGAAAAFLSCVPLAMLFAGILFRADNITAAMLIFMAVCVVTAIVMIIKGIGIIRLSTRFDKYIRILDGRTYADIKTLAAYSHVSEDEVLKTLKKMLKKGWFMQ